MATSRMQNKMRLGKMQEMHSHPVDVSSICCPDHVYELCCLFQRQDRVNEIISALLSLEGLLDTRYLLDNSAQFNERKKALVTFANEYALVSIGRKDVETAFSLLAIADTILGAFPAESSEPGLRTTTLMNLAFASVQTQSFDQALSALDEADRVSKGAKDLLGCASVKVTKSALFIQLKSYQEAYIQAQHAVKMMEDQVAAHPETWKMQVLLTAARLNLASAGEFLGGKSAGNAGQIRNTLVRMMERKTGEAQTQAIKEYDESPIYKEETKQAMAVSNTEDDLGSFLDGVQRWEKVRSIDNPSFVADPKGPSKPSPKSIPAKPDPAPKAEVFPKSIPEKSKVSTKLQIPPLPLASKTAKTDKILLLPRMPNSALPQIPIRSSEFKNTFVTISRRPLPRPDYATALDGLISLSEETARTIKTMDGTSYYLQCSLQGKSLLRLSAIALSDKDEAIPAESIDLEQLKSIVNMLGIAEVLPTDFTSKSLWAFGEAAHFFVLPFFQITTVIETGKKKIELWSISPGLLESQVTRMFQGRQRRLVVHQTSPLSLRLCLTDVDSEPSADTMISLDVVFDEGYKTKFLQVHDGKQSWVSFKPLNVSFLEKFEPWIDDMEREMEKSKTQRIILIRAKPMEDGTTTLLYYITDNEPFRRWDITVKRLSSSPQTLHMAYPYHQILSNFGILIRNLDFEDQKLIASLVLDLLTVQFGESGAETEGESLFLATSVTVVASHRTFIRQGIALVPVTLSVIGVKDRLMGIKATAFGYFSCIESGCFLYVNSENYAVQPPTEAPPKKKKKYNKIEGPAQIAEKDTSVMTLLREKGGWETLVSALKIEGVKSPSVFLQDKSGNQRWFGRLEALLPPPTEVVVK